MKNEKELIKALRLIIESTGITIDELAQAARDEFNGMVDEDES